MSVVQAFAHLPYVAIETTAAPMAQGELVHLDFDQWNALDGNFPFADRAYERSRPLFFQVDLDFGEAEASLDDAIEAMAGLTRRIYEAIVLITAARLPSPALSITYHVDSASGASATSIGPFEREVLLYAGDSRLVLDEEYLDRVRSYVAFVVEHPDLVELPEIAVGLATLERTSRPELTPLSSLAHEVAALEALLMPDVRTQLTATFARRAAALLAESYEELQPLHKRARRWYRARSEVLHGGDVAPAIADAGLEEEEFLFDVRRGLVSALGAALGQLASRPGFGLEELRAALEASWESEEAFLRLRTGRP